ncbi:hypothetical protein [Nocardiopsis sp. CNS-639]|uniref:hypothetical protein n=1 Tax=Nocardiopsis sp. CNS-639 TaxID=1169153 RepID=UPI0003743621|nr:hypothetical protein [Nocardiopsis sp. CNS-639]
MANVWRRGSAVPACQRSSAKCGPAQQNTRSTPSPTPILSPGWKSGLCSGRTWAISASRFARHRSSGTGEPSSISQRIACCWTSEVCSIS